MATINQTTACYATRRAHHHRRNAMTPRKSTPYDRGYLDGLRNHTSFFRPDPRYTPANRAAHVRGYTEAQESTHEAGLPEQRRLAALNLPREVRDEVDVPDELA